jgi:hypothetical protein
MLRASNVLVDKLDKHQPTFGIVIGGKKHSRNPSASETPTKTLRSQVAYWATVGIGFGAGLRTGFRNG